jgi:hypothetical protein
MAANQNRKRKLIAAINMTLDGFCDHTVMITDDEIHQRAALISRLFPEHESL